MEPGAGIQYEEPDCPSLFVEDTVRQVSNVAVPRIDAISLHFPGAAQVRIARRFLDGRG